MTALYVRKLLSASPGVLDMCRDTTLVSSRNALFFVWEGEGYVIRNYEPWCTVAETIAPEGAVEHGKALWELVK